MKCREEKWKKNGKLSCHLILPCASRIEMRNKEKRKEGEEPVVALALWSLSCPALLGSFALACHPTCLFSCNFLSPSRPASPTRSSSSFQPPLSLLHTKAQIGLASWTYAVLLQVHANVWLNM